MTSQFIRNMPHTLTLSTPTGMDSYGAASGHGEPRAGACRIELTTKAWYGADPSVSVAAKIYLDGAIAAPLVGDQATLTGPITGTYTVLRADGKVNRAGQVDHYVVWVG
jgi:hypothetical protein